MISERHDGTVVVWAPAKVNLYLEVLGKRPDGYHEIETLMVAVSLHDTLEFKEEPSGNVVCQSDHPTLSTGPDNLVCQAAALLLERCACRQGAHIRLRKRIPVAAGLAGGSTDAAAALAGLNRLWRLQLETSELAALAAELGSDVPFFLATPAAWCTGRGERIEPLPLARPLWFVLVCPAVGLATAEVYRHIVVPQKAHDGAAICEAVREGQIEVIGSLLHNRLEEPAQRLCPEIAVLKSRLACCRPVGQLMSGSGSSLFALCRDRPEGLRIAHQLQYGLEEEQSPSVFLVRSCF
jgi:4-diphosphocytidyl-2-C-methyl-D-erythritol kinase